MRELFLNDEEMAQFFYEKFLKMPAEEFEREYATIVNRASIADIVGTEDISQSKDVEQSARGRATLSDRELLEAAAARLPRDKLTESEKLALVDFQKKLDKLKELQEQRAETLTLSDTPEEKPMIQVETFIGLRTII